MSGCYWDENADTCKLSPEIPLRETLNLVRDRDPSMPRLLPNRNLRRLKARISYRSDGNADQSWLFAWLGIDRRTAFRAEKGLEYIAFRSSAFEAFSFPICRDFVGKIVGKNAEWRTAPTLTIYAVARNDDPRSSG